MTMVRLKLSPDHFFAYIGMVICSSPSWCTFLKAWGRQPLSSTCHRRPTITDSVWKDGRCWVVAILSCYWAVDSLFLDLGKKNPFSLSTHANVPGWTAAEVFQMFWYRNKEILSTGLIRFSGAETHCLTGMGTGRLDCMYLKTILDRNVPGISVILTPIKQLSQMEPKTLEEMSWGQSFQRKLYGSNVLIENLYNGWIFIFPSTVPYLDDWKRQKK